MVFSGSMSSQGGSGRSHERLRCRLGRPSPGEVKAGIADNCESLLGLGCRKIMDVVELVAVRNGDRGRGRSRVQHANHQRGFGERRQILRCSRPPSLVLARCDTPCHPHCRTKIWTAAGIPMLPLYKFVVKHMILARVSAQRARVLRVHAPARSLPTLQTQALQLPPSRSNLRNSIKPRR